MLMMTAFNTMMLIWWWCLPSFWNCFYNKIKPLVAFKYVQQHSFTMCLHIHMTLRIKSLSYFVSSFWIGQKSVFFVPLLTYVSVTILFIACCSQSCSLEYESSLNPYLSYFLLSVSCVPHSNCFFLLDQLLIHKIMNNTYFCKT